MFVTTCANSYVICHCGHFNEIPNSHFMYLERRKKLLLFEPSFVVQSSTVLPLALTKCSQIFKKKFVFFFQFILGQSLDLQFHPTNQPRKTHIFLHMLYAKLSGVLRI